MNLDGSRPEAVSKAAKHLAEGELLAFPTETVYGLGARADRDSAVAQIFAAKDRPSDHPLIVHVADASAAQAFTPVLPDMAVQLMRTYWPGPLTVVVPRQMDIAAAAAAGQDSIGLRCPAHPVALALLRETLALGVAGLAAPSANRFGRISPTRAEHVRGEFDSGLWVLDGGSCAVGIESTIVDCRSDEPVLLRPGQITRTQIEATLGRALGERGGQSPRVSGSLESHYAPRAPVRLMKAEMLSQALSVLGQAPLKLAVYSRLPLRPAGSDIQIRLMPDDPGAVAHELFAVLRGFDSEGAQLIWVEEPPEGPDWEGVRDRLFRASSR